MRPIPPAFAPIRVPATEGIAPFVVLSIEDTVSANPNPSTHNGRKQAADQQSSPETTNAISSPVSHALRAIACRETGVIETSTDEAAWLETARRICLVLESETEAPFPVTWFVVGVAYWIAVRELPPQGSIVYVGCVPGHAGEVPSLTQVANHAQRLCASLLRECHAAKPFFRRWFSTTAWHGELQLNRAPCSVQLQRISTKELLFDRSFREYAIGIVGAGLLLALRSLFPSATVVGTAHLATLTLKDIAWASLQGIAASLVILVIWLVLSYFSRVWGARDMAWRTVGWDAE